MKFMIFIFYLSLYKRIFRKNVKNICISNFHFIIYIIDKKGHCPFKLFGEYYTLINASFAKE